jgi:pyrroline-5-carboxylate reductase
MQGYKAAGGLMPDTALIGGGNMAEAIIRGLVASRTVSPGELVVSDVRGERLEYLRRTYGVETQTKNAEAARGVALVLLAVKPQVIRLALDELAGVLTPRQLVVSIAAGVPTAAIEQRFADRPMRVVRVMPNTPALVLRGISALAPGRHATTEDLAVARRLFDAVGRTVVVEERLLDAVTGLSGSGPAFVFLAIEAMADGGVKAGLPRDVAQTLAVETVRGAATLLLETGKHPGELKDMVASPGGTTIAGLHALELGGFRAALMSAVEAAARRSRELGTD